MMPTMTRQKSDDYARWGAIMLRVEAHHVEGRWEMSKGALRGPELPERVSGAPEASVK